MSCERPRARKDSAILSAIEYSFRSLALPQDYGDEPLVTAELVAEVFDVHMTPAAHYFLMIKLAELDPANGTTVVVDKVRFCGRDLMIECVEATGWGVGNPDAVVVVVRLFRRRRVHPKNASPRLVCLN